MATKKTTKKTTAPKKADAKKAAPAKKEKPVNKDGVPTQATATKVFNPKGRAIVEALRALKATSAKTARSAQEVAEKIGDDTRPDQVTRYGSPTEWLQGGGYVKSTELEDGSNGYYVTAKGKKADLDS